MLRASATVRHWTKVIRWVPNVQSVQSRDICNVKPVSGREIMGPVSVLEPLGAPQTLWKHFAQLSEIPRNSKHEQDVIRWICDMARTQGLESRTDSVGNLAVFRPGSGGGENAGTVIVQGHLDMVCEKNNDVKHDFSKDPILLRIDGDWLKASGTTLGADNGIGVAAALVLMESPQDAKLPPIEFLFTVDEETGLTGAKSLDNSQLKLKGRTLINMDTEEWGEICIGCAGGGDTTFTLPASLEDTPTGWTAITVHVHGLKGGHSGVNIHEYRGNAVKWIAEICQAATANEPVFRLAQLKSGDKRNAIAREGGITLLVKTASAPAALEAARVHGDSLKESYSRFETSMSIEIKEQDQVPEQSMSEACSQNVLNLLVMLPHGVQMMSHAMPGLVETSNNVASVALNDSGAVLVVCTSRSSVNGSMLALRSRLQMIGRLCGAVVYQNEAYPGWNPAPDSNTVQMVSQLYNKHFGLDPTVTAIHAGLECGVLNSRLGGKLDMVSYGPTIHEAHSPNEMCYIPSVPKFWDLTQSLLLRLADAPAKA